MYLMNPESPRELYAELLRTRQEERAAHRAGRPARKSASTARLRKARHDLVRRLRHTRAFAELAKS